VSSPPVDIDGEWAMFDFEDPVVVDIRAKDGIISGQGSCVPAPFSAMCAGELTGTLDDHVAEFGFPVPVAGLEYRSHAFVSADATRMAGYFSSSGPPDELRTAWVRPEPGQQWLSGDYGPLEASLRGRGGRYQLTLDGASGDAFETGKNYEILLRSVGNGMLMLSGALGAFWAGEMTWQDAEQTLLIGPVPETAPDFPVRIRLRFDAETLTSVEANLANDERHQPPPLRVP
jgi:hypothetical protein